MRRNPGGLTETRFDTVVVGGGLVGALTAWDAALRGLSVALVERGDFGACASSQSLRIVDGGLRYLSAMDVPRVRASMAERAVWLRMAPHLMDPLPVLVPLSGRAVGRLPGVKALMRAATVALRPITGEPNRDVPGDRRVPAPRALGGRECRDLVPELGDEVTGGMLVHDALVYSPERLVLEAVRAAAGAGAVAVSRAVCEGPLVQGGVRVGVRVRDDDADELLDVRARTVVVAAGAWGPELAGRLLGEPLAPASEPVLEVNVTLGLRAGRVAVVWGGDGPSTVTVPWRDQTVLGTGYLPWAPEIGADTSQPRLSADHRVVEGLLAALNHHRPGAPVDPSKIATVQAGFVSARLPRSGGTPNGSVTPVRRPSIRVLGEGAGTPVILGEAAEFTSSRALAEGLVDRVCRDVRFDTPPCRTGETPLPGAPRAQVATLVAAARAVAGPELPDDVVEHLVRAYGVHYPRVLSHRERDPEWAQRVAAGRPVIRAQLVDAVLHEGASTPDDVLWRRTELGATGVANQRVRDMTVEVLERWHGSSAPAPREPVSFPTWLVDGHAHVHPVFEAESGWAGYIDAVARNLSRAATTLDEPVAAGCLLLAGDPGDHVLQRLMNEGARDLEAAGWSMESTDDDAGVVLQRGDGLPLVLAEGRRVWTNEGVEVLALCTAGAVGERRPLDETIRRILEIRGVPVVPFGVGSWWGRRGRLVSRWLQEHVYSAMPGGRRRMPVFLGDSGNRLRGAPLHPLFAQAMDRGVPVLAGSDPLPLPGHLQRVGAFGFRLTGSLDRARPLASLRWNLEVLGGTPPAYGVALDPVEFVRARVARRRMGEGSDEP